MSKLSSGPQPWHAMDEAAVLNALATQAKGLGEEEAARRLESHGPNSLPETRQRGVFQRFLDQFRNVLIYVLLVAAVVTGAIGHVTDALVILGVVLINAVIGFVQEGRAEAALDAIREMLAPLATVRRDGMRREIPARELVPGDVVLLDPGDRVPADLRLTGARGLEIQEAALTGESLPVVKETGPQAAETPMADRHDMAYSSTLVTRGAGEGVVVATGAESEMGRIGKMIAEAETLETPLMRRLRKFGGQLTIIIGALAVAAVLFGTLVRGYALQDMFLAAVAIAVAAIPEGLPAIMTIALAIGVQRMASRNAIIRYLPAVEALGSVTVICTDKTGTLTFNQMMVERVVTPSGRHDFSGAGYEPEGRLTTDGLLNDGEGDLAEEEVRRLLAAGALCSDAALEKRDGGWAVQGDPLEGAILAAAPKVGLDTGALGLARPRRDVVPFESQRRLMAVLIASDEAQGAELIVKGAPETVLAVCDRQAGVDGDRPLDRSRWEEAMHRLMKEGDRVIAVARREVADGKADILDDDLKGGFVLLGLLGLSDPPRPEAVEAVAACRRAGIDVKMITGDHPATAEAVARRVGLSGDRVVTGTEIDGLDDEDLRACVREADVFARTTPEHKLRLVNALQARGELVAMTGDGVNDAPALTRADIGIAMGARGTEAAKDASAMVLADDNFASIVSAVEEGRTVYENLKKSIVFILPTSGGEAMVLIGAILAGTILPVTAVQILWVNMVTTVTLALALAFEPSGKDIMTQRPRPTGEALISGQLLWRTAFVSLLMMAGIFAVFFGLGEASASLAHRQTLAVNMLVAFEAFYLLNCRELRLSLFHAHWGRGARPVLLAIVSVFALQAVFTYWPPAQALFGTAPLALSDWLLLGAAGLALLVIVEADKAVWRLFSRRRPV
ncbi:cation-translocating P-type ATPase [Parvibaculum sp. MBR-TMA-1.3b-4.2]